MPHLRQHYWCCLLPPGECEGAPNRETNGLENVVALAAGPGNRLLIAQEALDPDPLHGDSEIREVTVSLSDRRPVQRLIQE